MTVESVEVYLESESMDNSPGHPVLTLTVSAVIQLCEWTGKVRGKISPEPYIYTYMRIYMYVYK